LHIDGLGESSLGVAVGLHPIGRAPFLCQARDRLTGYFKAANVGIPEKPNMKDHVYKLIELTGTSTTSVEDAIVRAIQHAYDTIKTLCWFQVVETRGDLHSGKAEPWQATIKVGFTVEG
jgi:flavin-binding protein dodecin